MNFSRNFRSFLFFSNASYRRKFLERLNFLRNRFNPLSIHPAIISVEERSASAVENWREVRNRSDKSFSTSSHFVVSERVTHRDSQSIDRSKEWMDQENDFVNSHKKQSIWWISGRFLSFSLTILSVKRNISTMSRCRLCYDRYSSNNAIMSAAVRY